MMKTRLDNDVSDCKGLVYAKPKLNYRDLFDRVCSVMKIRQDNNLTDHIGAIYIENNTKLFDWPNELGTICDKNQIG